MYTLIFLAVVSCALALLLTPIVRNLAQHAGLVDCPDQNRKIHTTPIARVGGVAIVLAALGSYCVLMCTPLSAGHFVYLGLPFAVRLLPALIIIFVTGLVDDIFQINPYVKLSGQILAAALVWSSGIRLVSIGGHALPMAVSFSVTLIWIVACANALNLIDGMDGLASGVALLAAITTILAALLHRNYELLFATVPLAGALLGFLRYNFNPASIFLGDCGSLTLGFLLGCYGVKWSEKSTTLLSMAAPVLALSVPLLDVVLAIGRRFLRNQPLFTADLSHIHHKLLSRGFSTRQVALILYASCGIAAIASVVLVCVPKQFHMAIILAVFCLALVSLRWLGYQEFGLAGKMAIDGSFQRLLNAQLTLKSFEQDLAKTASVQECWNILRVGCSQFGFTGLRLNVDGTIRETGHTKGWCVRIELPTFGYINLVRGMDVVGPGELSSSFADCVSRILVSKLEELRESEVQTTGKFIPVSSYPVRGEQKIVRSGEGD